MSDKPFRGFTSTTTYRANGLMDWAFWQLIWMDMKAKEGWKLGDMEVTITLKEPAHKWLGKPR